MTGISKTVNYGFDEAVEKVVGELKKEGFGILTSIDVKETFKQKIDVDFRKYTILGACNPQFAYQALSQNPEIGLLMPCNVVVYETGDGKTKISIFDPMSISHYIPGLDLSGLAEEGRKKLVRAIENL